MVLWPNGVDDNTHPCAVGVDRLDSELGVRPGGGGGASSTLYLESTRFQSLIVKMIHIAFNLNPCLSELAPLHPGRRPQVPGEHLQRPLQVGAPLRQTSGSCDWSTTLSDNLRLLWLVDDTLWLYHNWMSIVQYSALGLQYTNGVVCTWPALAHYRGHWTPCPTEPTYTSSIVVINLGVTNQSLSVGEEEH